MVEGKFVLGVVIGLMIGLLLFSGKADMKYHGTGGIGSGGPCYYPTERQTDGLCK